MNTLYTIIGKPFGLIMWLIYSIVKIMESQLFYLQSLQE